MISSYLSAASPHRATEPPRAERSFFSGKSKLKREAKVYLSPLRPRVDNSILLKLYIVIHACVAESADARRRKLYLQPFAFRPTASARRFASFSRKSKLKREAKAYLNFWQKETNKKFTKNLKTSQKLTLLWWNRQTQGT